VATPSLDAATWERMFRAPELVRERLLRATRALEDSQISYAVIGANAVAHWVETRDEGAVRNTPNVDVLIDPSSLERARSALEAAGFVSFGAGTRPATFLDGPDGKERQAVRVWLTGDQLSPTSEPLPALEHSVPTQPWHVISLLCLVRMKLTAYRTIDRVHLQDMTRVGLIDASWPEKFPDVLAERLRGILANPDG
jgi:hypothetical protein